MDSMRKTPYEAWIGRRICPEGKSLTAGMLRSYQLSRLNETIAAVRARSPFYRQRLQDCGDPPLADLADLERLPFTTEEDLRNNGLKMLCAHQGEISRVVTLETSGTTGRPKRLYFTEEDQALTVDMFVQSMSQITRSGELVCILLPAHSPGGVGDLLYRALLALGAMPERYGLISSLSDLLRRLSSRPVSCLVGIPVQVLALAKYSEMQKERPGAKLKKILLCTDRASRAGIEEIERIWDCRVFDYYGMTEAGLGGGMECPARCGYHLHEADLYFEIVDPVNGRPVEEGKEGEVVFSTLTRRGMPLIRYRTGDLSRFVPGPCPCGAVLRRLEKVRSRQRGLVFVEGGAGFSMADLDEALLPLPGIVNFSAALTGCCGRTKLEITLFALRPVDENRIRQALAVIPALGSALASGAFDLAITTRDVTDAIEASSEKRQIRTVAVRTERW
jgi:phenylacetate-coenzyme A ligase PaaK-like adenylate-forming protein